MMMRTFTTRWEHFTKTFSVEVQLNQKQKGFISRCLTDLQHYEIAAVPCVKHTIRQTLKKKS